MKITFKEEGHKYYIDGFHAPANSKILEAAGIVDYSKIPQSILIPAQDFGKKVHKATELDDKGILNIATLDPKIVPYLMAWRAFRTRYNALFHEIEKPCASKKLWFATTPDRIATIWNDLAIVEIKTTFEMVASVAIQMAGQEIAYRETNKRGNKKIVRIAVLLKPDGNFTPTFYTDKNDISVFKSAVIIHNYKGAKK